MNPPGLGPSGRGPPGGGPPPGRPNGGGPPGPGLPAPPGPALLLSSAVSTLFHSVSPVFLFSATIVASGPPGVQITLSPSTSADSR